MPPPVPPPRSPAQAFGDLDASAIVHAVAPDSEFGYEGLYTGALRDQEASGVSLHSPAPNLGKHSSWLQFSPPDQLLFSAWHGALGAAAAVAGQNETVATAALGAGVKGWRHTISAALGMEALAQLLVQGDRTPAEVRRDAFAGGAGAGRGAVWDGIREINRERG
eukprot:scaffold17633_cov80-Isochrysis_galbana.AAC.1